MGKYRDIKLVTTEARLIVWYQNQIVVQQNILAIGIKKHKYS